MKFPLFKYNDIRNYKYITFVHHNKDVDGYMCGFLFDILVDKLKYPNKKILNCHQNTITSKLFRENVGYNYESLDSFEVKNNKGNFDWLIFDDTYQYDDDSINKRLVIFGDVTPPIEWFERNKESITNGALQVIIYDHHKPKFEEYFNFIKNQLPITHIGFVDNVKYQYDNTWCGAKNVYNNISKELFDIPNIDMYQLFAENYVLSKGSDQNIMSKSTLDLFIDYISYYDTWQFSTLTDLQVKYNIVSLQEFFKSFCNSKEALSNYIYKHHYFNNSVVGELDVLFNIGESLILLNNEKAEKAWENKTIVTLNQNDSYNDFDENLTLIFIPTYFSANNLEFFRSGVENDQFTKNKIVFISYNIKINEQYVILSIRNNIENDIDCCKLAKLFNLNGGGHVNAAAATIPIPSFLDLIYKNKQ